MWQQARDEALEGGEGKASAQDAGEPEVPRRALVCPRESHRIGMLRALRARTKTPWREYVCMQYGGER